MTGSDIAIEVAVFTPQAALVAAENGADRIELCSGYSEGGLSPSAGVIRRVRESITIPMHVMVRPRIGDFLYSDFEKEAILADIEFCKSVGADGIVTGALTEQGGIDTAFIKEVVAATAPLTVTFHRAFDICHDMYEGVSQLIECGVRRILTSGGKQTALEGAETIARLVKLAGDKLIILPGSGINPSNVHDLISRTAVREVHLSAKTLVASRMVKGREVSLTSDGEVSEGGGGMSVTGACFASCARLHGDE